MPRPPKDGMKGFPEHGDDYAAAPTDDDLPDGSDDTATPSPPDPLASIRDEMAALREENKELRRMIPPSAPKAPETLASAQEDDTDWDKELFANPKAAVRKIIDKAREETEVKLRAEYTQDRRTTEFWSRFYTLHPDLREDSDLVEITLTKNMDSLANIPVEKAFKQLADLTRDRILRYAGGAARTRPKARTEGSGGPRTTSTAPRKPEGEGEEEGKVHTISSYLKQRRQKRRAAGA